MTKHGRLFVSLAVILAVAIPALCQLSITDPYEILSKQYEAIGGLERLKSEGPYHFEGTLSVAGLSGTIEYWSGGPGLHRTEVDLGVFGQTNGDNGDVAWEMDVNGKVSIALDEATLTERDLSARVARFEHLDRDSEIFNLTLEGVEDVEGRECYVVKLSNTVDESYTLIYVDTSDFMTWKTVDLRHDGDSHTLHSDYRDVGGVLRPFVDQVTQMPIGQVHTVRITAFDLDPVIDPSLFDPPEDATDDFSFAYGATSADVPFRFIERHLFVPVTLGGSERLWVLDTGASMSVIDAGYAAELGLETSGEMKGMGAGSTVEVSFVTVPPFSVPGVQFTEQQAASIEISGLFERTSDVKIGGILGYDFLSRFVTRVDYANEMLTLYDPSSFEYEGEGVALDAPLSGNIFGVEALVDGEHGGMWTLDLGASGMTFHYPYAVVSGFLERDGIDVVGFGAGGELRHRLMKFEAIEFAGFTVVDPFISCPTESLVGAFGGTGRTGNLGNTLFRHFVLHLDYERQQVIVEKGDDFGVEFPVDRSGVQLWRTDAGEIAVFNVSDGTPGADAGIRVGDVLTSIDGVDAAEFDLASIRELFRAAPGAEYLLEILNEDGPRSVTLVLEDIL